MQEASGVRLSVRWIIRSEHFLVTAVEAIQAFLLDGRGTTTYDLACSAHLLTGRVRRNFKVNLHKNRRVSPKNRDLYCESLAA